MALHYSFPKGYRVSSRENHRFCLQWLYIFIPQWISCLWEPRTFPSVTLYFHSSKDLYRVSSWENFGFCPQWPFSFSSLNGFTPCLLRGNYQGFFPQWLPLYFYPPVNLYHVSSERISMDFALSGLSFSSLSRFIPCLFRENFHGFYPQWFFFYFKSLTVLSFKGPLFTLLLWCMSVWTHEHRPTNGFVYWLSTFNAWGQLSQKRGTHPNLYWSILMVSGLNDNNLRFLIRWMCVETHLENSRKQVEKLPLT